MPEHLLGPHVVGQRVVIRRLVRGESGPTGGPAFTDVLGVCTAWGDGVMTLRPDSGHAAQGAPLEIALADIVSGKPVPPRPSHLTRVSAREAELRGLGLVPGVETSPLGEWLLRTDAAPAGRLLKRANSCLAMGSPGMPIAEAAAAVVAFYAERDRAPLAQVEQGSSTEADLLAEGWVPLGRGDASFLAAPLSRLHRLLAPRQARGTQDGARGTHEGAGPTQEWARGTHEGAGRTYAEPVEAHRTAASTSVSAQVHDAGGARIAVGSAVLDRDWLGIHGLTVDAAHRRRGLATAVMAELVEWGAEQGARTVWLHVETDNAPALALYGRLGFSEHHAVRYLRPVEPANAG